MNGIKEGLVFSTLAVGMLGASCESEPPQLASETCYELENLGDALGPLGQDPLRIFGNNDGIYGEVEISPYGLQEAINQTQDSPDGNRLTDPLNEARQGVESINSASADIAEITEIDADLTSNKVNDINEAIGDSTDSLDEARNAVSEAYDNNCQ